MSADIPKTDTSDSVGTSVNRAERTREEVEVMTAEFERAEARKKLAERLGGKVSESTVEVESDSAVDNIEA